MCGCSRLSRLRAREVGGRWHWPMLSPREIAGIKKDRPAVNYGTMTRSLRVTKWLGSVPAVGVCSECGREFKVPLPLLKRTSDAQENLRKQFAEHVCAGKVEGK